MPPTTRTAATCLLLALASVTTAPARVDDAPGGGWIDLNQADAWKNRARGWATAGAATLDPQDPRRLATGPGTTLLCNGPIGKVPNISTVAEFGDVEVRFDFLLPRGSNSGIKFQEVYEVQLFDSYGVKEPKGTDSGGVYPRSELLPKYHHIDEGHPPLVNAALPAGEWQTLEATFIAPRFDADGRKVADARISATLNGRRVQDNLKVATPTGNNHRSKEKATGPLLLQGDHGPVAIRNMRARRIAAP